MKILKLLNKKLLFLFLVLLSNNSKSNEPIDIWDLENIKGNDNIEIENNTTLLNDETLVNIN